MNVTVTANNGPQGMPIEQLQVGDFAVVTESAQSSIPVGTVLFRRYLHDGNRDNEYKYILLNKPQTNYCVMRPIYVRKLAPGDVVEIRIGA